MDLKSLNLSDKAVDNTKRLLDFLEKQCIKWIFYEKGLEYDDLVLREFSSKINCYNNYKVIVIKELPKMYYESSTHQVCLLLLHCKNDALFIDDIRSFNNKKIIHLALVLFLNGFCKYETFLLLLSESDRERIIEMERSLLKHKIKWHFITNEEIKKYELENENGELLIIKNNHNNSKEILLSIFVLENDSFDRNYMKDEKVFNMKYSEGYTLVYIYSFTYLKKLSIKVSSEIIDNRFYTYLNEVFCIHE